MTTQRPCKKMDAKVVSANEMRRRTAAAINGLVEHAMIGIVQEINMRSDGGYYWVYSYLENEQVLEKCAEILLEKGYEVEIEADNTLRISWESN